MSHSDPLYEILERHLYSSILEEETGDQLVYRVVADYLEEITLKGVIPTKVAEFVENDLRDEVRDMLRKKTYGYFSLAEFRKSQKKAPTPKRERRRIS